MQVMGGRVREKRWEKEEEDGGRQVSEGARRFGNMRTSCRPSMGVDGSACGGDRVIECRIHGERAGDRKKRAPRLGPRTRATDAS